MFTDIIWPIFNHCDVISLQIAIEFREKGLLRRARSFKVVEAGINRKPVCDFLLVINSD